MKKIDELDFDIDVTEFEEPDIIDRPSDYEEEELPLELDTSKWWANPLVPIKEVCFDLTEEEDVELDIE